MKVISNNIVLLGLTKLLLLLVFFNDILSLYTGSILAPYIYEIVIINSHKKPAFLSRLL